MGTIPIDTISITGQKLEVLPDYGIEFDPDDYIILCLGSTIDHAGFHFQHRKLLAAVPKMFHYKHYRADGSKFWTSKVGMDHYLAVPKEKIQIVREQGGSYPRVVIGKALVRLNVSGGGGPGWTDWVRRISGTCTNHGIRVMREIAHHAWTIKECKQRGITLQIEEPEVSEKLQIAGAIAKQALKGEIHPGMVVVFENGYTFHDKSEVTFCANGSRKLVCEDNGAKVLVGCNQVNWLETSKRNGMEIKQPTNVNRLL